MHLRLSACKAVHPVHYFYSFASPQVLFASDCVGEEVQRGLAELKNGEVNLQACACPMLRINRHTAGLTNSYSWQVLLLENTRFHPEEEKNNPDFAKQVPATRSSIRFFVCITLMPLPMTEIVGQMQLAAPADLYVNDAFGSAHRAHASTEGVTHYLSPNVAGFLMQKAIHPP